MRGANQGGVAPSIGRKRVRQRQQDAQAIEVSIHGGDAQRRLALIATGCGKRVLDRRVHKGSQKRNGLGDAAEGRDRQGGPGWRHSIQFVAEQNQARQTLRSKSRNHFKRCPALRVGVMRIAVGEQKLHAPETPSADSRDQCGFLKRPGQRQSIWIVQWVSPQPIKHGARGINAATAASSPAAAARINCRPRSFIGKGRQSLWVSDPLIGKMTKDKRLQECGMAGRRLSEKPSDGGCREG